MSEMYFNDDDDLLQHVKLGQNITLFSILQNMNPCQLVSSNKSTLLHYAVEYGNKDFVQYLIYLEANVDARNLMGETPLMIAVKNNNIVMLETLLEANADIFIPDVEGRCVLGRAFIDKYNVNRIIINALSRKITVESLNKSQYVKCKTFHNDCPLYRFIPLKNTEITRALIQKGSPVNAEEPITKQTALHKAVEELDVEHVKLLIEHRADIDARDSHRKRPLALIRNLDDQKALKILKMLINVISRDLTKNITLTLLDYAADYENKNLAKCLIELGYIPSHFISTNKSFLLDYTAKYKNRDLAKYLIDSGIIPCHFISSNKSTLLHHTAEYDNEDLAKYLIDLGANVDAQNYRGETPLMIAGKYRSIKVVEILLKANADIFIPNRLEHYVFGKAYNCHYEIKKIISRKITLESLNKSQYVKCKAFQDDCPLYYFISLKNADLTRDLIENGSPVDVEEPVTRKTALHKAVQQCDVENVKLLIKYKADINIRDRHGKRPLALISKHIDKSKTLEIVKVLINAGAILIDHDPSETLMKLLLTNGSRDLVRTVLQSNVDLYIKNKDSKSPIDYLIRNLNPDIYEELRNLKIDLSTWSNERKVTMLHRAAAKDHLSLLQLLLDQGADVNAKEHNDLTPLCLAICPKAYHGASIHKDINIRLDCIEMLLKRGANPQILTKKNYSHISAFTDQISDETIKLSSPVLIHLALQEASGRKIEQFMRSEIEKRPEFESIFASCKQKLKEMKQITIDESISLFDFLTVKKISLYAQNKILISNLNSIMKDCKDESYYYRMLKERYLKFTLLVVLKEIFAKLFNVSVISIAETIVNYTVNNKNM